MTTDGISSGRINSRHFYGEFHGHPISHLDRLLPTLRQSTDRLIFLAGDSSLDNKYWFHETRAAVGPYKEILYPPYYSKPDVAYWLNEKLENDVNSNGRQKMAAINTAVEATTLNERTYKLRSQDKFIRENIQRDDILVVSVGGNDVALCPCPCTIVSILCLLSLPQNCIENGFTYCSVPIDDYCCGCGPSLLSCAGGCPPCLGYFKHLFGTRVEKYIKSLTRKQKPKQILVCMIYFPDESMTPSWASGALSALGYNKNPGKLQALIRRAFVDATSNISIPGSQIIPVGLFNVLDGQNSEDYIARVEPSPTGGAKMADYILHVIQQSDNNDSISSNNATAQRYATRNRGGEQEYIGTRSSSSSPVAPTTSYMGDRM